METNRLNTSQDLTNAFQEIGDQIYAYIYSRVGYQKEMAEDLAQEVFLKAWKNKKRFDSSKSSLKNWLYTIAHNLVIDYYRTKKKHISFDENKGNANIPRDLDQKVEEQLIVKSLLQKLPDDKKELLILRYINNLSIKEVSKIIGKKYTATKVAIHRAIKKLREVIKENE